MYRGKRNVLLLVLLLTMTVLVACGEKEVVEGEKTEDYIAVEIGQVVEDSIGNSRKLSGKVVANEEVMVTPKVGGVVETINVKLGDFVKKDSVLFVLEQDDISKNVDQAQASLNLAQKSIDQANNSLQTAVVNYELTKEKIDKTLIDLERTRELYEEGAVSKSQLEQAELAASPNQLEVAQKQVDQARIAVGLSEEQYNQANIGHSQSLDGLDNAVVRAPMDGIISELNVKRGQIAGAGQVAATIVDMNSIYLKVDVVENVINKLKIGQSVGIKIPAAFNEETTSTISYISSTADGKSNLYSIRVYLDNLEKDIRPGMNGEISLSVDEIKSALIIDSRAVLDRDGEKIVYILEDDRVVERVVSLGIDAGDYVQIEEGLKKGEQVIVKGQHYVEDGGKVKVVQGGK